MHKILTKTVFGKVPGMVMSLGHISGFLHIRLSHVMQLMVPDPIQLQTQILILTFQR